MSVQLMLFICGPGAEDRARARARPGRARTVALGRFPHGATPHFIPRASGGDIPDVPAGGQAYDALEVPGEVRLVVEAGLRIDLGDRQPGPQERFGVPYPNLRLVSMGRHSNGLPEDAAQVEGAEAGQPGQG